MKQKHSKFGIVSFVIAIFFSIFWTVFTYAAWAMNLEASNLAFYLYCIIPPFIYMVALLLGIWGLTEIDRKKLFAILGTIFSAAGLILYVAWYIDLNSHI